MSNLIVIYGRKGDLNEKLLAKLRSMPVSTIQAGDGPKFQVFEPRSASAGDSIFDENVSVILEEPADCCMDSHSKMKALVSAFGIPLTPSTPSSVDDFLMRYGT